MRKDVFVSGQLSVVRCISGTGHRDSAGRWQRAAGRKELEWWSYYIEDFGMRVAEMYMYLAPHDNYISPLPSRDSLAVCHPGQVRRRRTRAGIQKESDYIELSLDSGSRSL